MGATKIPKRTKKASRKRRPPRVARTFATERLIGRVVDEWTDRYRITKAERGLLLAVARHGTPKREVLARALGVTPDTVKSHAHSLLRRVGADNLLHASYLILRQALVRAVRAAIARADARAARARPRGPIRSL